MLNRNSIDILKSCLLLLALIGVFAKGMIPIGFMPNFLGQTGTAIVICSGFGEKTIYVDEKGAPVNHKHQVKSPCDFSYTPVVLVGIGYVSLLLIVLIHILIRPFSRGTYVRPYAHAPPITGPPVTF